MESNKRNLQKWNAVDFVGLTCVHPSRSVSPRMRCRMPSAAAFLELEPLPCLGGPLAALICKAPLFSFSLPWPTADDLATEEQRRCASDVSSRVDEQPVCPINLPDRGIMLIIPSGHDQGINTEVVPLPPCSILNIQKLTPPQTSSIEWHVQCTSRAHETVRICNVVDYLLIPWGVLEK